MLKTIADGHRWLMREGQYWRVRRNGAVYTARHGKEVVNMDIL